MSNNLINEKSPYLLQHANNPVNWYPWCNEAFEKAEKEDKPIFLSVGYATCHWCHVMEKETFEDKEAATYLNDTFICIKVDREERPDIDTVYMTACQMLTGRGGWPLTIFMTPDKKPFFGATYLPKVGRFGMAGVIELCQRVKELWTSQRKKIIESAVSVSDTLKNAFNFSSADEIASSVLEQAYLQSEQSFDKEFGGFSSAPKFPTPHRMLFLLRYYLRTGNINALQMTEKTLTAMRLGGIWDHVGFGFHRYSTDKHWLLPHFEKMLYDQALLAITYLETYQITKNPFYAKSAEEIFTYVLRDMTSSEGGFFTAEDADSEGEEGKFYVWNIEEFQNLLGDKEESALWEKIFNLKKEGNFADEATKEKTGANILYLSIPLSEWADKLGMSPECLNEKWERVSKRLFEYREKRIHPFKDDKILTDWNGLMIAAFALGARILDKSEYAETAKNAVKFVLTNICNDSLSLKETHGHLPHRYRDDEAGITAYADDYAFLIWGLIELYKTTSDMSYLEYALMLQEKMISDYWDNEKGGFFLTAKDKKNELPVRPKELYDGAIPSANSVSFMNMLKTFKDYRRYKMGK